MYLFPRDKTYKIISSANTAIFSFSNADNSLAEKDFYTYFAFSICRCRCIKLKVKLFFVHHFWRHLLTRIILLAGHTIERLTDFITTTAKNVTGFWAGEKIYARIGLRRFATPSNTRIIFSQLIVSF